MVDTVLLTNEFERNALIPMLQKIQEKMGYVPREAIKEISRELRVSTSEIFGVLTFYAQFRLKPVGEHLVKICRGTACHVRGASLIIDAVDDELGLTGSSDTTEDLKFTVEKVACFGACSLAPVVIVDENTKGNITPDQARRMIRKIIKTEKAKVEATK
jgi:NADH-quinone oxidoreductase subunit E